MSDVMHVFQASSGDNVLLQTFETQCHMPRMFCVQVLDAAGVVVADNDNDGVAEAILRYVLS